jgi:RNA polymerase sigma-70 factor (ECF subfamily)
MSDVLSPESSVELLARWRAGDQQAAAQLWRRYAERLIALVRSRLSARLSRHLDPEDLVQSAYRCFFSGARSDHYVLQHSGDLWRLLVTITRHKLYDQFKRYATRKRDLGLEQPLDEEGLVVRFQTRLLTHEPSPAEAAALADELEEVLRGLKPIQRRMVELRLEGYRLEEIAEATQHHERTVRRLLKWVKQRLQQRCRADAD